MERYLREKYNPDGSILRQHQLKMLDILIIIDRICKKHGIKYWISDGTLLGAVRHGGFIPWDDDLDIQMMRKDFKHFIKIISEELPENLALQTHKTDKGYVAPYAKIRELHSTITEFHSNDVNYKYKGIYIDVFPLERCSKIFTRIADFMHTHLYKVSHVRGGQMRYAYVDSIFKITKGIYSLFRGIDSIFVKSGKCTFTYGSCFGYHNFVDEDIMPLSTIEFEGYTFNAPHVPETVLKKQYGNYMDLPAEEDRMTHTLSVEFKVSSINSIYPLVSDSRTL